MENKNKASRIQQTNYQQQPQQVQHQQQTQQQQHQQQQQQQQQQNQQRQQQTSPAVYGYQQTLHPHQQYGGYRYPNNQSTNQQSAYLNYNKFNSYCNQYGGGLHQHVHRQPQPQSYDFYQQHQINVFTPAPPPTSTAQNDSRQQQLQQQQQQQNRKAPLEQRPSGSGNTSNQQLRSPAAKRPPDAPVMMQGWLHKQGSDGLMLWRRRWFVLSEYCLFYYKGAEEEKLLGSVLLPSYKVSACSSEDKIYKKFAFKLEHANMRTYILAADSQQSLNQWIQALNLACTLQTNSSMPHVPSPHTQQNNDNATENAYRRARSPGIRPNSAATVCPPVGNDTYAWDKPDQSVPQPLYANAPPKPRRLVDGRFTSPSPDCNLNESSIAHGHGSGSNEFLDVMTLQTPQKYRRLIYDTVDQKDKFLMHRNTAAHTITYGGRQQIYCSPDAYQHPGSGFQKDVMERRTPDTYGRSKLNPNRGKSSSDYEDVYNMTNELYKPPLSPVSYGHIKKSSPMATGPYQQRPYFPLNMEPRRPEHNHQVIMRQRTKSPKIIRPHSADFLEYEMKHQQSPNNNINNQHKQPERPKSSLDINRRVAANDNYFYSEEHYAEKMRQSALYLQRNPSASKQVQMTQVARLPVPKIEYSVPDNSRQDFESVSSSQSSHRIAHGQQVIPVHPEGDIYSAVLRPEQKVRSVSVLSEGSIVRDIDLDILEDDTVYATRSMPRIMRNSESDSFARLQHEENNVDSSYRNPNDYGDQFSRSASVRLARPRHNEASLYDKGEYIEKRSAGDGERKREESMKRLLEWKQRMLQSPLNRKLASRSKLCDQMQPAGQTHMQGSQHADVVRRRKGQHDNMTTVVDNRRYHNSTMQNNSYSSDDEENDSDGSRQTKAGRTADGLKYCNVHDVSISESVSSEYENVRVITSDEAPGGELEGLVRLRIKSFEKSTCDDSTKSISPPTAFEETKNENNENYIVSAVNSILNSDISKSEYELLENFPEKDADSEKQSVKNCDIDCHSTSNDITKDDIPEYEEKNTATSEEHYMVMSPKKSILGPSRSAIFDSLHFESEESSYVEMTQNLNVSLLEPQSLQTSENKQDANSEIQPYEIVCFNDGKIEPVYMELNRIEDEHERDTNKKTSTTATRRSLQKSDLPDIVMPSQKQKSSKSDSSDADDEASKDLDSLDAPCHPRFSLSDTFRPASYYLGASRMMTEFHDSSDSELVSPPPIPTSPPLLDDLDTSAQDSSYSTDDKFPAKLAYQNGEKHRSKTSEKKDNRQPSSGNRTFKSSIHNKSESDLLNTLTYHSSLKDEPDGLQTVKTRSMEPILQSLIDENMELHVRRSIDNKVKRRPVSDEFYDELESLDSCLNQPAELEQQYLDDSGSVSSKDFSIPGNTTYAHNETPINHLKVCDKDECETISGHTDGPEYENVLCNKSSNRSSSSTNTLTSNASGCTFVAHRHSYGSDMPSPVQFRDSPSRLSTQSNSRTSAYSSSSIKTVRPSSQMSQTPDSTAMNYSPVFQQSSSEFSRFCQHSRESSDFSLPENFQSVEVSPKSLTGCEIPVDIARENMLLNESETSIMNDFNYSLDGNRSHSDIIQHENDPAKNSKSQLAPYYYSDLSVAREQELYSSTSTREQFTLNNQRNNDGVVAVSKRDIRHIVNPINRNRRVRFPRHSQTDKRNAFQLASEARSASVDFLNLTDKSGQIDKRNIYESDSLKRQKVLDSMTSLQSNPETRNLYGYGANKKSVDIGTVRRCHSLEGLLRDALYSSKSAQDSLDDNKTKQKICQSGNERVETVASEGDHLWEEDHLWQERLRNASHRHARSLDDLDSISTENVSAFNSPPANNSEENKTSKVKITRGVTYVNDNVTVPYRNNHNGRRHFDDSSENDVYVQLSRQISFYKHPSSSISNSNNGKNDSFNCKVNVNEKSASAEASLKEKSSFIIDREKLRQWDLMSSAPVLPNKLTTTANTIITTAQIETVRPRQTDIENFEKIGTENNSINSQSQLNSASGSVSVSGHESMPPCNLLTVEQNIGAVSPVRAGSPHVKEYLKPFQSDDIDSRSISPRTNYVHNQPMNLNNWSGSYRGDLNAIGGEKNHNQQEYRQRKNTGIENVNNVSNGSDGLTVSAGELLGRTHEELVLLLIQLRRQSVNTYQAIETCYAEIEALQSLFSINDAAQRLENIQRLNQLKQHLVDLEKQYEKSKPLVNLVDNMVKLGSLYRHGNRPGPNCRNRERLEFNQHVQERRLLAEERRDWDRLSPDHSQLQNKVQQLYELDGLLRRESNTLSALRRDKEALEYALHNLRSRLNGSRTPATPPAEIERAKRHQHLLEQELSRVHQLLAYNSKKLEETVAGNARLEQELLVLRQKLQMSRSHRQSNYYSNTVPKQREHGSLPVAGNTSTMLESELRRVQQLVGDLQRQRKELSVQVRQLTDKSNHLVQQIRPRSITPTHSQNGSNMKKRSRSLWLETDLDLMVTHEHSGGTNASITDGDWDTSSGSIAAHTTPLYINTAPSALQPSDDSTSAPLSSDTDVQQQNSGPVLPHEKQKTVRIVKRESERRQRDRERTGYLGIPLIPATGSNAPGNPPGSRWEALEEENHEDELALYQRSASLPRQIANNYTSNFSGNSGLIPIYLPVDKLSISEPNLGMASPNSQTNTLNVAPPTDKSPEVSPIFKSEAAKQIIIEMSGHNPEPLQQLSVQSLGRRTVPREKRRHYTAPHHSLSVKGLDEIQSDDVAFNRLGMEVGRARDDLDMERALRPRHNTPDVVRSTLSQKELKYNEETIDSVLGAPSKIVIPERYVPEEAPQLSPEELRKRMQKVESIKKMLSDSTALTSNSVGSDLSNKEKSPGSTLKYSSISEEKRRREHLLQLNQILAKQVMEMSKIVAEKALATLPLKQQEVSFDEDDLSPVTPLPIYQQRENYFS